MDLAIENLESLNPKIKTLLDETFSTLHVSGNNLLKRISEEEEHLFISGDEDSDSDDNIIIERKRERGYYFFEFLSLINQDIKHYLLIFDNHEKIFYKNFIKKIKEYIFFLKNNNISKKNYRKKRNEFLTLLFSLKTEIFSGKNKFFDSLLKMAYQKIYIDEYSTGYYIFKKQRGLVLTNFQNMVSRFIFFNNYVFSELFERDLDEYIFFHSDSSGI